MGIENVKGYLSGGVQSWHDAGLPVEAIEQVSVAQLKEQMATSDPQIGTRRPAEYVSGHVPRALNAPCESRQEFPLPLKKDKLTAVICAATSVERGCELAKQQQG